MGENRRDGREIWVGSTGALVSRDKGSLFGSKGVERTSPDAGWDAVGGGVGLRRARPGQGSDGHGLPDTRRGLGYTPRTRIYTSTTSTPPGSTSCGKT